MQTGVIFLWGIVEVFFYFIIVSGGYGEYLYIFRTSTFICFFIYYGKYGVAKG